MAKVARIKPARLPGIRTWDEADEKLKQIAALQRELEAATREYEEQVAELKQQLKEISDPINDQIEAFGKLLETFATENMDAFADKRTKTLHFGELGFKVGKPTVKGVPSGRNEAELERFIANLKARRMFDCVRTVEEVDKNVLRIQPPVVLSELGVSVVQPDEFWFQPFREEVPEVVTGTVKAG
jgi:phage host-nuclease inhibitor protein Gam